MLGIFPLYQRPRFLGDFLLVLDFFSVEEELEDGLELLELLELLGLLVNFLGAELAGLGLESMSRIRYMSSFSTSGRNQASNTSPEWPAPKSSMATVKPIL